MATFYWSITNEHGQTRTCTLVVQLTAPYSPDYYRCASPAHDEQVYRGVHARRMSVYYLQAVLNITEYEDAESLLTEAGLSAGGAS